MNTYAFVDQNMCNIRKKNVLKRIWPKKRPNYFFKTSPDGRYIYYIGMNKNWRIDTQTGEEILLPGNADPVPSSDGKILTSINFRSGERPDWSLNLSPMKNWDIDRTSSGHIDYSKTTIDSNTARTYQSVGTLGENRYRILSYDERVASIVLRDYKLMGKSFSSVTRGDNYEKLPQLRLPMISKDGAEFSSLDIETNETVLYKINKDGSGAKEIERLNFPSGKVDFSSDNRKIVFHVTETVSTSGRFNFSEEVHMPAIFDNDAEVRNIFVYDRDTKSIIPITQNQNGNSYYPVFLQDNRVVYLDQTDEGTSFVIADIPKEAPKSLDRARSCFTGDNFDNSLEKLANMWSKVCTDWEGGKEGAGKMMMLNMSNELCLEIAASSGDKNIALMCEALKKSEVKRPNVRRNTNQFKKMVKVKCMICHQGSIPFFDSEKVKSHKNEILRRINSNDPSYSMPPGSTLSAKEKGEFKDYLNSL